jgi:hypothetical protein
MPAVLTNWWPPGMRPWHVAEIFIQKMLRRRAEDSLWESRAEYWRVGDLEIVRRTVALPAINP